MYLLVNHANRYIDEKGVNKYLIFDSTEKNKELLKKYVDVWNGIIDKIKEISSDECDYEKDYMKIKFNSDDDLPLNKQLEFYKHVFKLFNHSNKPFEHLAELFKLLVKLLVFP